MNLALFLRGLLVGFAIAAPVGPIGLLCIQRTLAYGRLTGLVTGLGAASADALYRLVAGLGVTAVSTFLSGSACGLESPVASFFVISAYAPLWPAQRKRRLQC